MLLTISTTHQPATDLGYLLHKNPDVLFTKDVGFGVAHVFYPEASTELCTAALTIDIDPVGLVRGRGRDGDGAFLKQYVNDRPYAANSFMSVAMGRVFSSALSGASKERPELAATAIPLTANIPSIAVRGTPDLVNRLFVPLGYTVELVGSALDDKFPEWGQSNYYSLTLSGSLLLKDLLTHLYVLIPVLDNDKHYWVAPDEIEKLLKRGEGWLAAHPEKDFIVSRYLRRQKYLIREALSRLLSDDPSGEDEQEVVESEQNERPVRLHDQRLTAVLQALVESGAKQVIDLGCGEGKLTRMLLAEKQFEKIAAMDVSWRSLEIARDKLRLDRMNDRQRSRIDLFQGSLTYRDERLSGFDGAAIVEVIEHLDINRLATFERIVFEFARPRVVALTTPNAEYNVLYGSLPVGEFRHGDHRFEWGRAQFEAWGKAIAIRFEYDVRFQPVGPVDDNVGAPSQMAVFTVKGNVS